jgi:DNA-binding MurR/RpiR family transcriptional regulator
MKHTARQLAHVLGVQPSTITRDIKKGKISANKNERGEFEIDASEIARAYAGRIRIDGAGNIAAKGEMQNEATPKATDATATLQARLEAAERLLDDREQTIDDLRRRLDEEAEERRKLTAILTDQRAQPPQQEPPLPAPLPPPRRGLRGWLHRVTA